MTRTSKPSRKWELNWSSLEKTDTPNPPGMISQPKGSSEAASTSSTRRETLVYNNAMKFAQSPFSNIFMTGFMLYMSGKSIQIFSMITLGMALWNPAMAILSVNQAFSKFQAPGVDLLLPKLLYCALQLAVFSIALYKCQVLGLLPTEFPVMDLHSDIIVLEQSFAALW